jgi:glycosyltransferase involved in cell wall biosynthesis
MEATPLLSVCCVTYQHAAFIRQSIESMLAQETSFPIEICIGEDESSDGTREVCQEMAGRDKRIRLFLRSRNEPGRDQYTYQAAYNWLRTLTACRGRYVAELEGDDYWTDPRKLQKQVSFLEAHQDHTLCYHNAEIVYQDAVTPPHPFNPRLPASLTVEEIIEREWQIPSPSLVFRRSLVDRFPAEFRHYPSGDLALHILAAAEGKLHGFEECMAVYRKNTRGASYAMAADPQRGIEYWIRVNAMLDSLDRALDGRYHRVFRRRMAHNNRRIDYVRLKHGMQFSPRVLWNGLRFFIRSRWN